MCVNVMYAGIIHEFDKYALVIVIHHLQECFQKFCVFFSSSLSLLLFLPFSFFLFRLCVLHFKRYIAINSFNRTDCRVRIHFIYSYYFILLQNHTYFFLNTVDFFLFSQFQQQQIDK